MNLYYYSLYEINGLCENFHYENLEIDRNFR